MRQNARAVVQMARATDKRNDENKADTIARRAKMVFGDGQAGRQIKKPGQAGGHRSERQEGRLAKGQAAQGSRRPCVTRTDAAGQPPGRVRGVASASNQPYFLGRPWGRGKGGTPESDRPWGS
jgi:hypothetical protein